MSIQMTLIFGTLVFEMAILTIFVLPLPHKVQDKFVLIFYKLYENQNVKIGTGFFLSLISIIFFDALRISIPSIPSDDSIDLLSTNNFGETGLFSGDKNAGTGVQANNNYIINPWEARSKKFHAQRNLYITGAVLFFAASIFTIVMLLKNTVKNKEILITIKKGQDEKGDVKRDPNELTLTEFELLKEELKKKETDAVILRKQYEGLSKSYDLAADKANLESGSINDKKSD
ncbi:unnamed protein product [[Candida] boidinii]|uniref:Endoplasmic reticulum transmembrane protein n=1 Tax=Candida boidinii TaxID=5477 RepID=A0A9W6T1P2_CANBO|nr:hypothetical protein B5S30_g2409 [[Candida] boidinii]OWB85660.1 hypothetical protein B5S33_g4329 [[Candida] boidinii]GME71449.1 unnamed protein product [[Candida] boidinii]GMG10974.1 unnamed protein product [[Candida] boidinii]